MARQRDGGNGPDRLTRAHQQLGDAAGRAADRMERLGGRGVLVGLDAATGKVNTLAVSVGSKLAGAVTRVTGAFGSMFSSLATGFGLANNQLVQLAASANPAAAVQLDLAMRALSKTLGDIFLPILRGVTQFLRFLADTLYNLSPATKALIVGIGAVTVAFAALIPVMIAVTAVFTAFDIVTGGIVILIGALATVVAAAVGGLGYFAATSEKLTSALEPLSGLLNDLIDIADELISAGMGALADVLGQIIPLVQEFWQVTAPLREELVKLGRALGPLLGELVRLGAVLMEAFAPIAAVLLPDLRLLTAVLAEMVRHLTIAVTVLTVLGRRAREGGLADFAGMAEEVEERLADLNKQRQKLTAPGGVPGVRFTQAEELGRAQQQSAMLAAFGAKAADPAKRAEAQRKEQIDRLKGVEEGVNKIARVQEQQAVSQDGIDQGMNAIRSIVEANLGPLAGYLRWAQGG
jgi:hypothetical protein